MTLKLPTPPKAALEVALHRLDGKGRYNLLVVETSKTSGNIDVEAEGRGGTLREQALVAKKLTHWARDVFAAFAPLPLVRAAAVFHAEVGRQDHAPGTGATDIRSALLALTRRVADEWPNLSADGTPVRLQMGLARKPGAGKLIRDLRVGYRLNLRSLDHGSDAPIWQTVFERWLEGVYRLDLTFLWTQRPTAHFLAAAARSEVRS